MAITIAVGGVDRTNLLGSLRFGDVLNGRLSLEATFQPDEYGVVWIPEDGESVLVEQDGVEEFGGNVREPETVLRNGVVVAPSISAVSFEAICDRRLVAAVYEDKTLLEIVTDIVTNFLDGEGFTLGGVETGPTIEKIVFNYVSVTAAFNELSEMTGYPWWSTPLQVLQFRTRESVVGPTTLTTLNCDTARKRARREGYRNLQYVRAGTELTDSRTESFIGDGTRKTFTLSYPVGVVPTAVTVNGAAKTIGIRGIETGKDWYWNKDSSEIVQDDGAGALSAAQTLAITYQGLFPIIVSSQDDSEIAARIAAEGGTGRYEAVDDAPDVNASAWALALSNAKLARYGHIQDELVVTTLDPGFRAGQLASVNMPELAAVGEYLIESADHVAEGDHLRTTLTLLSGDTVGGWQAFYRRLQAAGRTFVVRDNEVLILARRFSDGLVLGDSLAASSAAPESRVGTAMVGFAQVAA